MGTPWVAEPARDLQGQIKERLEANLVSLDAFLSRQNLATRLVLEAGWYVVLRVPGLQPGEEMALDLLLDGEWWCIQGVSSVFLARGGWW